MTRLSRRGSSDEALRSTLLEALDLLELPLSTLGFADDINLLTYSESTVVNCITLESAHDRCLAWASTYGMKFALRKYTFTHFT
jgi:hypothetical protein